MTDDRPAHLPRCSLFQAGTRHGLAHDVSRAPVLQGTCYWVEPLCTLILKALTLDPGRELQMTHCPRLQDIKATESRVHTQ